VQYEVDRPGDVDEVGEIATHQPEAGMALQVSDIGGSAGEEVVQTADVRPGVEQLLADVRTQEPRTTGDDGALIREGHRSPPPHPSPAVRRHRDEKSSPFPQRSNRLALLLNLANLKRLP
jgi:hypothetical protein